MAAKVSKMTIPILEQGFLTVGSAADFEQRRQIIEVHIVAIYSLYKYSIL